MRLLMDDTYLDYDPKDGDKHLGHNEVADDVLKNIRRKSSAVRQRVKDKGINSTQNTDELRDEGLTAMERQSKAKKTLTTDQIL